MSQLAAGARRRERQPPTHRQASRMRIQDDGFGGFSVVNNFLCLSLFLIIRSTAKFVQNASTDPRNKRGLSCSTRSLWNSVDRARGAFRTMDAMLGEFPLPNNISRP